MHFIDNAEQLNSSAVDMLKQVQERVTNGHFLMTSRRPLLSVEDSTETVISIHPFRLIEGVELLTQHCERHLPNWRLQDEHRFRLVDIVRRLDGIPLALDLAGSRLSEMSLKDLHPIDKRHVDLDVSLASDQPTLYRAMQWSVGELKTHQTYF